MACQHCGKQHPPGTPKCPVTGDSMQQPGVVGTRVDRYQVERLLGAGGFGAVYLAKHVHTDSTVALKLLKKSLGADQQMLERFLREARAAASVGSEHIVRVMDAGQSNEGQAFLALEYLDGLDLKELAAQQGPLPAHRLVLIVLQALEALQAAHAKGIVHRDMKPANVFVVRRRDERGTERDFVKLLDFGISKMHGEAGTSGLTMTGVAMGTPSYMAPEQFFDARGVDARADLYSVSAMLYELLSGKLPFDAESYAHLIVKVRTEQAAPLHQIAPGVPLPLAQVVMVGLAKEPLQRWQSAREFSEALRSAVGLPAPGNTPAFLPTQSGTQPALAPADGNGLEKTHTPQPRMSPPLPPDPGWLVPSSGSSNTGLPLVATPQQLPPPQPSVPPPAVQSGWVVPPVAASAPPAPQKSSALKWVMIVLGMMFLAGGCCTCAVVQGLAEQSNSAEVTPSVVEDPVPADVGVVPDPDVGDDAVAPDVPPEPEPEPAPVPPQRSPKPHPKGPKR